jgi:DNA segregation ATPase FtsK/SpoIIIE-like protein
MKLFELFEDIDRRNPQQREIMYNRAKSFLPELDRISGPSLARKMQIPIDLAYRLLDELEKENIVGRADLNGKRELIKP